jgi:hypothetical protein
MKQNSEISNLLAKLRQPLGIEFISENILKMDEFKTKEILNELIEDGVIEKNGEYYVLKKKK